VGRQPYREGAADAFGALNPDRPTVECDDLLVEQYVAAIIASFLHLSFSIGRSRRRYTEDERGDFGCGAPEDAVLSSFTLSGYVRIELPLLD
jgi:hypothetical protein